MELLGREFIPQSNNSEEEAVLVSLVYFYQRNMKKMGDGFPVVNTAGRIQVVKVWAAGVKNITNDTKEADGVIWLGRRLPCILKHMETHYAPSIVLGHIS